MSTPVMEAHSGAFRSIPVIISTEMYSSFQVAWAAVCSKVVVLLLLILCFCCSYCFRAYPGSKFVVANTLAKWKKLEPNEINFSQGFSQKVSISFFCI